MSEELQSLRDAIAKKIKTGEAHMRPRWHFVLRAALLVVGVAIVVVTVMYLFSFAFFILHNNGTWFAPSFGLRGVVIFLLSLPWFIVLAGAVFIIILEMLVRHYSFAYRRPLLYSLSAIIILVLAGSVIISQTPFHERMFSRARNDRLPFAGGLYRGYGMQHDRGAHIGVIKEFTESGFRMAGRFEENLMVIVSPQTQYPSGTTFNQEDTVVVLGRDIDGTIRAQGVVRVRFHMRPQR